MSQNKNLVKKGPNVPNKKNVQTAKREQPKKDSKAKRVNYDNTRESKFIKDVADKAGDRPIDQVGKGYTKPAVSPTNHDEFWNRNPEMLKAAGSLAFATIAGSRVPLNTQTPGGLRIPGVMQFSWVPALGGFGPAEQDAVQQSSISTYSFMVHANSRDYTYEAADNMIMILGGFNVFAMIVAMTRAFGVAQDYTESQLNKPDGVLEAMGFSGSELRRNLSQMWWDINELINRSKQIWVPHTMPILDRWLQLSSGYYKDDSTFKSQYYIFTQNLYWKFSIDPDNGSQLIPVTVNTPNGVEVFNPADKTYPWSMWVEAANSMFNALLKEEDRGVIYGDILNAYGASHIFALSSMPNDFKIVASYDPIVLSQIENLITTNTYGGEKGSYTVGVAQNAGEGILYPVWSKSGAVAKVPVNTDVAVLNWHQEGQPDPMSVMKMTRCMTLGHYYAKGRVLPSLVPTNGVDPSPELFTQMFPYTLGTEQIINMRLFTREASSSGTLQFKRETISQGGSVEQLAKISPFDWHPFMYPTVFAAENNAVVNSFYGAKVTNAVGDYSNYTTIEANNLSKLHRTALFSALGVPQA